MSCEDCEIVAAKAGEIIMEASMKEKNEEEGIVQKMKEEEMIISNG